jgi:hypothetical protein
LNDASRCHEFFGPPAVSTEQMVEWIAHWIEARGAVWNKPTHFEARDGKF